MHEVLRHRLLRWAGRAVTTHPVPVLGACAVVAVASIVLAATRLEFQSDRSALVSTELDWNRRYLEFKGEYPRWNDLIVAIEGDADDERIDALARRVGDALRGEHGVRAADAGFTAGEAGPRLFRTADGATFGRRLTDLADARRIAAADNPNEALAVAAAGLQRRPPAADGAADGADRLADLQAMLEPYLDAVAGEPARFDWLDPAGSADAQRWQPLRSASGRIRFVLVRLDDEVHRGVNAVSSGLAALRGRLGELLPDPDDPTAELDLEWGVTGIPAIEADETGQSIHDSTVASILAATLITALMILVFRGLSLPLLAAASLATGVAWSFGWLVLAVGHLQLLSVVFTVILLGLGIDFALHLVARLELIRSEHDDLPSAMARVFAGVGPGLITGALTTAGAFAVIALTEFRGMAEMGIIAAGGIVLCLIAMCTAFPAALALTRWKRVVRERHGGEAAHFAWARLDWVDPHPIAVLVGSTVVVVALALAGARVRYDPNVLNLQSPNIESVRWEQRILDDASASIWAALIRTTPEEAGALADRLRTIPVVEDVGGMGTLVPSDRAERADRIAAVRADPVEAPQVDPGFTALRTQLATLRFGLGARRGNITGDAGPRVDRLLERLDAALATIGGLAPEQADDRWQTLASAYETARPRLARFVDAALDPAPPDAADLPPVLRDQWIGDDGSWLLRANPAVERGSSILDPKLLEAFVAGVREVAPSAFGPPIQIYESSELIVREYVKAAIYAVITILVILVIDFRSPADALSALLPVAIGFVGAFGIMGATGTPLNFANIIVMPIIFGIGAAAGVHVVHRWRADPTGRPSGLSGGTGRAVTLTMATTMIGFGCMLIAEHRGIRSLGLVMVAGLGVTLLACYTALPALLQLRHPGHPELEQG